MRQYPKGALYFNSNLVRLKEEEYHSFAFAVVYFNSNLVRLKGNTSHNDSGLTPFQFQSGTIKGTANKTIERVSRNISIPIWYD